MKLFLEIIGYTIILILALYWYGKDLDMAVEVSTTLIGCIVFIYSTIGMYENLKNVGFRFRDISKKSWIRLGIIYICVWSIFILILSDTLFLVPCIQIPLILIVLLIYDRISNIFKKQLFSFKLLSFTNKYQKGVF